MEWNPIETAPLDETTIVLLSQGVAYSPCIFQESGVISEHGFWLWWQAPPEFFVEIKNPTHWMILPKL